MKPWIYNAIAGILVTVLLLFAAIFFLGLMFVGSAFRVSNITQLNVFSPENLKATIPVAVVCAVVGLVVGIGAADRKRG